jgi:3-oxoacyl-[acyl-carrier-protein] synthase III
MVFKMVYRETIVHHEQLYPGIVRFGDLFVIMVRIIDAVSKKNGIPPEKFLVNLQKYGNTAAASVGLALNEYRKNGTIVPGNLVLVMGFGGGLSWGGLLIRF